MAPSQQLGRRRVSLVSGLAAVLSVGALSAEPLRIQNNAEAEQTSASEKKQRAAVAPFIRAVTNCLAKNGQTNPAFVELFESGGIRSLYLYAQPACRAEIEQLETVYDRTYGAGSGHDFIEGAYLQDLPRALIERWRPEVAKRKAALEREEAAKKAAEKDRLSRVERLADLKRDEMYECTRNAIGNLVSSSETANVLTSAAMTVCKRAITEAVDARIQHIDVVKPGLFNASDQIDVQNKLRETIRENVLAQAVKARADMSSPSRSSQKGEPDVHPTADSLATCLVKISQVQKGKLINQDALIKVMMDLCRPEIEGMARAAYLGDKAETLEKARERAAAAALEAAKKLVSGD